MVVERDVTGATPPANRFNGAELAGAFRDLGTLTQLDEHGPSSASALR
jgi:hypothetical protein